VQRVLDDLRRLASEVEQPSNLGDGQRDHAQRAPDRRRPLRYC
jgi:hypothetical protein